MSGVRSPTEFNLLVTIDGKDPKVDPTLKNITDGQIYDHPSFKLMAVGDVMKEPCFDKEDGDWSEIDPEIVDQYIGLIPGTVTLAAFNQEITWAVKHPTPGIRIHVAIVVSPPLPDFSNA